MTEEYSIIFQKEKEGSPVKDLVADFSMVCTSFPFQLGFEAKEIYSDDWADEDGEDMADISTIKLKAYDLEAEIGYTGSDFNSKLDALVGYLLGSDGNGIKLKVYNPHTNIGRKGIRFVKYEPEMSNPDMRTFKITFRVTEPASRVTPSIVNGVITDLT